MKKLHIKNGRKIVALGLAALLLFVPFSSNLGENLGVNAEGGEGGEPTYETVKDITYEIPEIFDELTDEDKSFVYIPTGNKPKEVKVHTLSDKLNIKLNPTVILGSGISDVDGTRTKGTYEFYDVNRIMNTKISGWDCKEEKSAEFDVNATPKYKVTYGFEYYFFKYEDTLSQYVKTEPENTLGDEFVLGDEKVVLYVKPVFYDIELVGVKVDVINKEQYMESDRYVAGDENANIEQILPKLQAEGQRLQEIGGVKKSIIDWTARAKYSQMATYEKVVDDITQCHTWTDASPSVEGADGVDVYSKVSVKNDDLGYNKSDTDADLYVGTVKQSVQRSETLPASKQTGSWETAVDRELTDNGYYYGYTGYFVPTTTAEGTSEQLVDYAETLSLLKVDKSEPVINLAGLYEYPPASGETPEKWTFVASSGNTAELLMSQNQDLDNDKTYRYVVTVEGAAPISEVIGYNEIRHDYNMTVAKAGSHKLVDYQDKDIYYYEIEYNDVKDESEFTLYVAATDKIGNKNNFDYSSDHQLVPKVKKCKFEKLAVYVSAKKSDGLSFELSDESNHTNDDITLTVEAFSRCEIESMWLMDGEEEIKIAQQGDENTDTSFTHGNDKNVYYGKWIIVLPSIYNSDDENSRIENLKIRVKDDFDPNNSTEKGNHDVTIEYKEFVYDITRPNIIINDEDVLNSETKWYQNYELTGKINSGNDKVEDYLAVADYYIDRNGGDALGVGGKSILADENNPKLTSFKDGVTEQTFKISVPESLSLSGTNIRFVATDQAGNKQKKDKMVTVCVDKTNPVINAVSVYINEDEDVNGQKITKHPTINVKLTDNLSIDRVDFVITYPNGTTVTKSKQASINAPNQEVSVDYRLPNDANLEDGEYTIKAIAYDKSGRASYPEYLEYDVDTKDPIFKVSVEAGAKPGQKYVSSSVVRVLLKAEDDNVDPAKLVVTDNGEVIHDVKWFANTASLAIIEDGTHNIELSGTDAVGNTGEPSSVSFVLDTIAPDVTPSLSGPIGNNGVYRGQVTVSFSLGDEPNEDTNNYHWTATRTLPNQQPEEISLTATNFKTYPFTADGTYHITFYAVDLAGNVSETKSVDFAIDATAPQAQIIAPEGTVTNDANVTFNIRKPMWEGLTAKATIFRKAGDGVGEQQLDPIDIPLTGAETSLSRAFSDTGVYRVELTITDAMGNTAIDSKTFTVDKNSPVISMTGANNYDKFDKAFDLEVQIDEEFYASKQVSVKGTRTDIDGKIENLDYRDSIAPATNPTIVKHTFDQDGIYDITVYARDAAGNETTNSVHFVIDKTKPAIGDLSAYDNKVFNEFKWDIDLDELVSDLTVCDVHMYLNGSEYDGSSNIEDGAYTLVIKAVDELGHESEKAVNFILDTKAPVFIVSGVEDGQIKNEAYKISVSLQLDEDILDSVQLNGKPITVSENNTAQIDVVEEGKYELILHARDAAGNEAEQTISFAFGTEKKASSIWLIAVIAGGVLVIGGFFFIILAKKRRNN